MYVILAYDIDKKRVAKVMKTVKKYLRARQRSVFDGYITEGKLNSLKRELAGIIVPDDDAVIIYKLSSTSVMTTEEIGLHSEREQQFL